jgi:hypothetical protein
MIVTKSKRVGQFRIFTEPDERGRVIITVYLDFVPVVRFDRDNINERKLAAVELVERCRCSNTIAGKICGFHRNTVFKLLRIKKILGIEAIFEDERGPKSPFKYVGKVRSYIKKLLRKHPELKDQAIADLAGQYLEMEISRSAVARIRTEKQDKNRIKNQPGRADLIKLAKEAEAIERERYAGKQILLNFTWDKELKKKTEEFAKEDSPKAQKEIEQRLITRLQRGERCHFAGGLMHHLFLNEIGFNDLLSKFPANCDTTYKPCDILLTLYYSAALGIPSIEALKLFNASEIGVLIGMNRIPDKDVIRAHLGQLASHNLSTDLVDDFARRLLLQEKIDPGVFFIDGHFLPYYGLNVIAKGYYTVRRLAMRGNELYAVTDIQGRPLFFITESNEIDFRPIISRCAGKLKEFGIARPMLVFDRGGYGIHFFKELGETADFVTWAKYISSKSLDRIPDESFIAGIRFQDKKFLVAEEMRIVSESVQTAKKNSRSNPASLQLRLVVLKDVKTGKRIGIYTGNTSKPCYDIAWYMLQRWGDSENFFKEMMNRFNLDYHPGYDIRELEKQPLVDNPDIALIKKAVRTLKNEVVELEKDILAAEARLGKRKDKRLVKKIAELTSLSKNKKDDIEQFEKKVQALPDKVSILDILKGKPMKRCDLEKKRLYDLMQFMAFHSRERLVEIFRECYNDNRDIKKVLDMIAGKPGYVKLIGQTLVVLLDWIENKKHREAAQQLCCLLNQENIRLAGRLDVKLFFYISHIAEHGSTSAIKTVHNLI